MGLISETVAATCAFLVPVLTRQFPLFVLVLDNKIRILLADAKKGEYNTMCYQITIITGGSVFQYVQLGRDRRISSLPTNPCPVRINPQKLPD